MSGLPHRHLSSFLTDSPSHTHIHTDHGEAKQAASLQTWDKERGKETTAERPGGVGQTTGLVCHQSTQCWHLTYLCSITVSLVVIQRGLWGPWTVPGFSDGLSDYVIPANKMGQGLLSGPEASWRYTAHIHLAKLPYSAEQGGCVWELSGAKLVGIFRNLTMAHAVSLTIWMFTSQCLVCED